MSKDATRRTAVDSPAPRTLPDRLSPDELEMLLEKGRRAWPDVVLDRAVFVAHLAAYFPSDQSDAFRDVQAGDLYLACACARGIPEAITAFEGRYLATIGSHLSRFDRSPTFVDEVRQRLRERLLVGEPARIATYAGKGPLGVWVRVAAIRIALDLCREWNGKGPDMPEPDCPTNPEQAAVRGQYRAEVETAFRSALSRLGDADRNLLRLHYVQGHNFEKLARLHEVDRSTISRRVSAAQRFVLSQTRQELQKRVPAMSQASRDNLLVELGSKIQFSFETALGK